MSEKYQPKQGDRVRVVLEGDVSYASPTTGDFDLADKNSICRLWQDHVVSVEKLADPEPEWAYGAVVRLEGHSSAFWYNGSVWRLLGGTMNFSDVVARAWERDEVTILWNGDDK